MLQACLFAIDAIGSKQGAKTISDETRRVLYSLLGHGDSAVQAAAARALIAAGTQESLPYLKKTLDVDEWCLQTEARKAITKIEQER